MSNFYEVEYTYCGVLFKTTMLADSLENLKSRLPSCVEINSYKVLK